jgi:MoaA/NifB/PqqE/SkfB family radical SAM enzyme
VTGKRALNVHLHAIPNCNLRCKHCYYCAWPLERKPERLLSLQSLHLILTRLSDNYDVSFDMEGGELFLRKDIPDLFECVPLHYWRGVTITTNGTLSIPVHPDYLRHLADLRVSVEGHTNRLQREIRGIDLEPVLSNCVALVQQDVPVTLRVTLHRRNYKYLSPMLARFAQARLPRLSLFEFQAVGRGRDSSDRYRLGSAEMESVLQTLVQSPALEGFEEVKLSLSAPRTDLVHKYSTRLSEVGFQSVNVSHVPSLTIDYNGDLGVCPWGDGDTKIGQFDPINFESQVDRYMREDKLMHECSHCSAVRLRYRSPR